MSPTRVRCGALEEGKAILEPTGVVPCHDREGVTPGHPVTPLGDHRDPDAGIDLVLDGGSSGAKPHGGHADLSGIGRSDPARCPGGDGVDVFGPGEE